jgi:hypothetical protein
MKEKIPVTLRNYKTGKTITAQSMVEASKKTGIPQSHISLIVNRGTQNQSKGWYVPNRHKGFIILDIFGHKYKCNDLMKFCKTYSLNYKKMLKLMAGEIKSYRGLYISGNAEPVRKKQTVFSFRKESRVLKFSSIKEAAKYFGCTHQSVWVVIHGLSNSVKGWELIKIEERNKKGKKLLK